MSHVSRIYEKCAKSKLCPPTFKEDEEKSIPGSYKMFCIYKDWTVSGSGICKKSAKQNAAKSMLEKMEEEKLFEETSQSTQAVSAISKINEFCSIKKKDLPKYSDLAKEDDLFVFECELDGFVGKGVGKTKKEAKENSAEKVVQHFDIHSFYESRQKLKDNHQLTKNSIALLHEKCQRLKLDVEYEEEKTGNGYVVKCVVGEYRITSEESFSKKMAKNDAAYKMLNVLKDSNYYMNSPFPSPKQNPYEDTQPPASSTPKPLATTFPPKSTSPEDTKLSASQKTAPSKKGALSSPQRRSKRAFPPSFLSDEEDINDEPSPKQKSQ